MTRIYPGYPILTFLLGLALELVSQALELVSQALELLSQALVAELLV